MTTLLNFQITQMTTLFIQLSGNMTTLLAFIDYDTWRLFFIKCIEWRRQNQQLYSRLNQFRAALERRTLQMSKK